MDTVSSVQQISKVDKIYNALFVNVWKKILSFHSQYHAWTLFITEKEDVKDL